jgi:hypothetical protein
MSLEFLHLPGATILRLPLSGAIIPNLTQSVLERYFGLDRPAFLGLFY